MINGRDLNSENIYLKNTVEKIQTLLDSYVTSSEEQNKDIIKQRKFLWDNRNELDEIDLN